MNSCFVCCLGIDVFHDKSRKSGSIAGVVSSVNQTLTKFYSSAVFQQQGQELVDALKIAFLDAMMRYYDQNHKWPSQVVVFRDGVGDGQLEATEKHEAAQFMGSFTHASPPGPSPGAKYTDAQQATFARFGKMRPDKYTPGFTFVVVQKRINTRLFHMKSPKTVRYDKATRTNEK